jgi:hypothetical protein
MAKRKQAKRRPTTRRARGGAGAFVPKKLSGKVEVESPDEGPRGWFLPQVEQTYTALQPADAPIRPGAARIRGARGFASTLQPGEGENVLHQPPQTVWVDRLAEYKQRKAAAVLARRGPALAPAPAIPGAVNWMPLGPTVVLNGQTVGEESVAGRIVGLSIAPGGQILYAASACGGVFRSNDGGTSWHSLMDGFDVDPTNFASSSLACGAIAIDPSDPNRVYVGTGEGETHEIFHNRVVNALPAYRGIGPIRTDDGGDTWQTENTVADSKTLAGEAFFALAVDPRQRENVIAATTAGLYQRTMQADGTVEWVSRRDGVYSSVVVASAGAVTRFFAAEWAGRVWMSTDGEQWTTAGSFPLPASDASASASGRPIPTSSMR